MRALVLEGEAGIGKTTHLAVTLEFVLRRLRDAPPETRAVRGRLWVRGQETLPR